MAGYPKWKVGDKSFNSIDKAKEYQNKQRTQQPTILPNPSPTPSATPAVVTTPDVAPAPIHSPTPVPTPLPAASATAAATPSSTLTPVVTSTPKPTPTPQPTAQQQPTPDEIKTIISGVANYRPTSGIDPVLTAKVNSGQATENEIIEYENQLRKPTTYLSGTSNKNPSSASMIMISSKENKTVSSNANKAEEDQKNNQGLSEVEVVKVMARAQEGIFSEPGDSAIAARINSEGWDAVKKSLTGVRSGVNRGEKWVEHMPSGKADKTELTKITTYDPELKKVVELEIGKDKLLDRPGQGLSNSSKNDVAVVDYEGNQKYVDAEDLKSGINKVDARSESKYRYSTIDMGEGKESLTQKITITDKGRIIERFNGKGETVFKLDLANQKVMGKVGNDTVEASKTYMDNGKSSVITTTISGYSGIKAKTMETYGEDSRKKQEIRSHSIDGNNLEFLSQTEFDYNDKNNSVTRAITGADGRQQIITHNFEKIDTTYPGSSGFAEKLETKRLVSENVMFLDANGKQESSKYVTKFEYDEAGTMVASRYDADNKVVSSWKIVKTGDVDSKNRLAVFEGKNNEGKLIEVTNNDTGNDTKINTVLRDDKGDVEVFTRESYNNTLKKKMGETKTYNLGQEGKAEFTTTYIYAGKDVKKMTNLTMFDSKGNEIKEKSINDFGQVIKAAYEKETDGNVALTAADNFYEKGEYLKAYDKFSGYSAADKEVAVKPAKIEEIKKMDIRLPDKLSVWLPGVDTKTLTKSPDINDITIKEVQGRWGKAKVYEINGETFNSMGDAQKYQEELKSQPNVVNGKATVKTADGNSYQVDPVYITKNAGDGRVNFKRNDIKVEYQANDGKTMSGHIDKAYLPAMSNSSSSNAPDVSSPASANSGSAVPEIAEGARGFRKSFYVNGRAFEDYKEAVKYLDTLKTPQLPTHTQKFNNPDSHDEKILKNLEDATKKAITGEINYKPFNGSNFPPPELDGPGLDEFYRQQQNNGYGGGQASTIESAPPRSETIGQKEPNDSSSPLKLAAAGIGEGGSGSKYIGGFIRNEPDAMSDVGQLTISPERFVSVPQVDLQNISDDEYNRLLSDIDGSPVNQLENTPVKTRGGVSLSVDGRGDGRGKDYFDESTHKATGNVGPDYYDKKLIEIANKDKADFAKRSPSSILSNSNGALVIIPTDKGDELVSVRAAVTLPESTTYVMEKEDLKSGIKRKIIYEEKTVLDYMDIEDGFSEGTRRWRNGKSITIEGVPGIEKMSIYGPGQDGSTAIPLLHSDAEKILISHIMKGAKRSEIKSEYQKLEADIR